MINDCEKRIIKKSVTHQNIGGKEFVIEKELDWKDVIYKGIFDGNWACKNFLTRRSEAGLNRTESRVFYGKVDGLGYIVAEDEFEGEGVLDDG